MKIIDLTLTLYDGLLSFPSHPPIEVKSQSSFENSKHKYEFPCEGFESRLLKFSDHSGTHIDAPLHFIRNGASTLEINIEKTIGTAVLLDVSEYKNPFTSVTSNMLEKAEIEQGIKIEEGDIVLVRTRKGEWGSEDFFNEHSFDISAGIWFRERKIKLVGIDLPNIDNNSNKKREVHFELLRNNIYIVENLVNLHSLPLNEKFKFVSLPLKIKNATGSPIRAIVIL